MRTGQKPILIILIAGIGDLILASKSIRTIRNGFPDKEIHLLANTAAAPIAKNYRYIDQVWSFPIRELRENKLYLLDILKLIANLRKINFDMILNLYRVDSWPGGIKMGLLFFFLKAKLKIGHDHYGFGLFIDKKSPKETFKNRHFVDAMTDIALLAGGKTDEKGIEVFWEQSEDRRQKLIFKKDKITIGINAGGDRKNRRWNLDHYATVTDFLSEHFHAQMILLGGPGEEEIAQYIQNKMKNEVINLAGQLTLNDLIYIINRLTLLVTNDSGPMHMAAAVKTPVVAIFGPEDPTLLGPYTSANLFRIVYKKLGGLNLITPEDVKQKCLEILTPH